MIRQLLTRLAATILSLSATGLLAAELAIQQHPDGSFTVENDLLTLRLDNQPTMNGGITAWTFKPTGHEMVDVLYGQTDYIKGHLLGERWDSVEMNGYRGGAPAIGSLYAPESGTVAADGTALALRQVTAGDYTLSRTCLLRRGLATAEFRYRLENKRGGAVGTSLRLHGAISPGARGPRQSKEETLFLDTVAGILEIDQAWSITAYRAKYSADEFFNAARSNEPPRTWCSPASIATPVLQGNWAAWVNRDNGDGIVLIFDPEPLLGFYNSLGSTIEPVMRAIALKPGESWGLTGYAGSFTGAKGRVIRGATPLYVVTEALAVTNGALRGEIIPLFSGKLLILDGNGKPVFESAAAPDRLVALNAAGAGAGWSLVARDGTGREIGRGDARRGVTLAEPAVTPAPPARPRVEGDVYIEPGAEARITALVAGRNYAVQCDFASTQAEKTAAQELAKRLSSGLLWTTPDLPVLAVGNPSASGTIRDIGLLKQSLSPAWPGPGKGAILLYDSIAQSRQPAVLIAGSDEAGTLKAVNAFKARFLGAAPSRANFDFWVASPSLLVHPHTPASGTNRPDRIVLDAARGEYEPAQIVITAFENLDNIEVTLAPLISAKTGLPAKWTYERKSRRRNGPLWLRWVRYFPLKPENGWTGRPDPILERPDSEMDAGRSQALWLTALVSETAEPGRYTSAITCTANGIEKTIPLELNVWDFTLPLEGLKGEPYMDLANFPPDGKRELTDRHVEALVDNMVDHGMRMIHLNGLDMTRWHFSTNGAYKGMTTEWLEVSDDGGVVFDAARFDRLVEQCDKAAKPFKLDYMVYLHGVLGDNGPARFKAAFPTRFTDKPPLLEGPSQSYYIQEMLTLLRRHLERRGWMNRVVVKIGDEPPGFDWWWTRTQSAREAGVPMMSCFNSIDWKEAEKGLGNLRVWQPLYMHYDESFFKKVRAAGDRISWYNCGPPPRTSTGTDAAELRGYLWQAAKADLDIVAWWGIQNWASHSEVWGSRYSHWNSVMYPAHPDQPGWQKPGKSGWVDTAPIDSIRWEHIRDGMEDAWYVNLLRTKIALARANGRTEAADQAQAVLDAIWTGVFPTLNDYNPGYERMMECRRNVAEAILKIQSALKP